MSGHSHWAGIKHKKGLADAKRGKLFSKLTKNIMIAARSGPYPETNSHLREAIEKAKRESMPKVNIERLLKKLSGEGMTEKLEELTYEGYAPGGIAILVEVVTDNRNRTASELRKIFDSKGGKMGESGCVSYLFDKKGVITVPATAIAEEQLMSIILDAGAENLSQQQDVYEITTAPADFQNVKAALEQAEIPIESAEIAQVPKATMPVTEEMGRKILNLIEMLEDQDDAQNVYANYDIPAEVFEKWQEEH